jgi:proteasome lid subunit RPN8/RPN11
MIDHCRRCAPEEACGALVGHPGGRVRFEPVTNDSPDPRHHFWFEPSEWARLVANAHRGGEYVLAIVHSHPSGPPDPSYDDRHAHEVPGVLMVIVDLSSPEPVTAWHIEAGNAVAVQVCDEEPC